MVTRKRGVVVLLKACVDCCLEEALAIPFAEVERYAQFLSEFGSKECLATFTERASQFTETPLSPSYAYLFGAVLTSRLYGRNLDEAVADLVVSSYGWQRQ